MLDTACAEVERDPASIEVSVEMQVLIAPTRDDLRVTLADMLAKSPDPEAIDPLLRSFANGTGEELPRAFTDATFVGTPGEVRHQIERYVDAGADHFLLWFLDAPDPAGMDLFARQVTPAFR